MTANETEYMSLELQLLLVLAIIVIAAKIAGHICQRYLNQPVVFGEILMGLLLGPTLINLLGWPIFHGATPEGLPVAEWLHEHIVSFAQIGVLLLMFIAGLETDLSQLRKVGKSAMVTAILGVAVPLGFGALVTHLFGGSWNEAIFVGTVLTATSVSITAQTLMEIRQLRSVEGVTILGAAVIDDVLGIIILALVIAFGTNTALQNAGHESIPKMLANQLIPHFSSLPAPLITVTSTIVCMALFFLLSVLIGRRIFPALMEKVTDLHASHIIPATALVLVFLFAIGAEFLGQVAAITGAYLVGVFLGRTRFKGEIESSIHPFTYAFFVPIFLISIGLPIDIRQLGEGNLIFAIVIILVAIITKVIGCGVGARLTGCGNKQALRIGLGMISRGEVGLIIAQIGLSSRLIDKDIYTTIVLMVLATTVVTPLLLRWSFPHVEELDSDIFESVVGVEMDVETAAEMRKLEGEETSKLE